MFNGKIQKTHRQICFKKGAGIPNRIPLKPKLGRCAYKETKLHKPLRENGHPERAGITYLTKYV